MKKDQVRPEADPSDQVDEAFEPWEQGRPVPLFLIAVVFALGIWGTLTYFSEHASQGHAARQRVGEKANVDAATGTASIERRSVALRSAVSEATGVSNADPATLQLVQAGKGAAWGCASCHGAAGEGNLTTPRLAGQPAAYLAKQLDDFASGLRANAHMAVVAKALSLAEMQNLAQYYAQIRLPSTVIPSLGGNLDRGRALALHGDWKNDVPACVACHGMNGEGVVPSFPALAGQRPEYIFAQLADWHAGGRGNSPQRLMDGVAKRMTVGDMRDVSDYFASLPVRPAQGSPDSAGAARASAGDDTTTPAGRASSDTTRS